MRLFALMAGLALANPAHAAPPPVACDAPMRRVDLDEALGTAEIAIAALDTATLGAAMATADRALKCLAEPVDASAVARWYRARGIHAFVSQDEAGATAAFRAARAIEPGYRLDPALGAPIRAAWDAAAPPEDTWTVALPVPAEGWLQVDGRRSATAPAGRGYVLQWFDAAGAVRLTAPVGEGSMSPPYPVDKGGAPAPLPEPVDPARPDVKEGHPSRGLLVTGLTALAVGGASIGASAAMQSAFLNGDRTSDERPGLVTGNQVLGVGGAVVGAVGVGAVVGAVIVGRW